MITGSYLCCRLINLTVCYWESTLIGVNCPYVYGEALLLLVCGFLLSTSAYLNRGDSLYMACYGSDIGIKNDS